MYFEDAGEGESSSEIQYGGLLMGSVIFTKEINVTEVNVRDIVENIPLKKGLLKIIDGLDRESMRVNENTSG